jgi:N-acetylmuramoyl-L-alanine amidase
MRFGRTLLLLFVAGCSAAPVVSPTPPPTLTTSTVAPAPPTSVPTSPPTAVANLAPAQTAAEQIVASVADTATPTAAVAAQPIAVAAQAASAADQPAPVAGQPAPVAGQPAPVVAQATPDPSACDGSNRPDPLPAPGTPRSQDFFRSFRTPLAPAPLYDPPGQRRVGLQAGHWMNEDVPPELGRLQGGAVGGGKQEWQVNLDVAQRVATLLQATGVQVDVLPATIPPGYRANAFIAIHADGDPAGVAHGFKVARPGFSSLPDVDDRLVSTLNQVYGADTELPRDDEHISLRMLYYYAFNSRRYCHAVAPGVPQAIIEMGYLTSPTDRQLLIGDPDRLAHGLADGIQTFLSSLP